MTSLSLNIDPVVICPYDSNHLIAKSRIAKHIVKCERHHPVGYKVQCPYDATHRFFPQDLEAHVETCPMKLVTTAHQYANTLGSGIDVDMESSALSTIEQEEWEEDKNNPEPLPKEPTLDKPVQRVIVNTFRGNAVTAKRIGSTMRRPFGYSESMMLDFSSASIHEDDDDTDSIECGMDHGRGRALNQKRGQPHRGIRGISILHRRGFRGRLP
ncbi:uncharacterized protein LOC106645474 [Copidosoma floridanum]|uniref:uncharacterized protein LOC106645474 n=1 Tax=Copidosoma floridanum TaxID=29053 RepID=UPI0006C96CD4|nr:uncharacterized protein LOC106645474 [Copidosoma floridanum]